MITDKLIARINELARKKRTSGLTEAEQKEQKELYAVYLKGIRGQVKGQLSQIRYVGDKKTPLQ
ncbi:DUF896 domain-containing protein [Risungbinella massiliensis]|uniref:DUF896 domain-containing protein n=1 Tax=Risungbinella massiliensis TaxID=1329796 RepID=UPI0005CB8784|nr:DUF896 domain-containing protein [Risungbinella massiliensis]